MIFLIPAVAIAFVVGELRCYLLDPAERNPNVANGFAGTVPALISTAIALVSLGLAFLVIYRLDESHFGRQGAVRWVVAGAIYGLLEQVVLTPIPSDFDFKIGSSLRQRGGICCGRCRRSPCPIFSFFHSSRSFRIGGVEPIQGRGPAAPGGPRPAST
jgi:hypothetical protein